ncbi:MAG: hypothetical protein AAF184_04570 [Pseudomonadota bacterium]
MISAQSLVARDEQGVQFAANADGKRSTTAISQHVLASALQAVDSQGAVAIRREGDWRKRYGRHFLAMVRAGVERSDDAMIAMATRGLDAVHGAFEFLRDDDQLAPRIALERYGQDTLRTGELMGEGARQREFTVPYGDQVLAGDALRQQIDRWQSQGILEPTAAHALHEVCAHQHEWLDLRDQQIALLGAGAELGPFECLSAWGADLIAVDIDRPAIWQRLFTLARSGAGRLRYPLREAVAADASDAARSQAAGADLLLMTPEVTTWLAAIEGPMCVGAYGYMHGRDHVRLEVAMDAVMEHLTAKRLDVSLAFLLTPSDVFAVPEDAAAAARQRYASHGLRNLWRKPLNALTGGRLYVPNVADDVRAPSGSAYGLYDGIVPAQGPNYALAKHIQKWRALHARAQGVRVSANVAPSTATASVLARRAFGAAFAGAAHYGVEIFAPATSNALMAALLVHDLRAAETAADPTLALSHPSVLFTDKAVHGGLWRIGVQLRSVLEIAALRGMLKASPQR